MKIYTKKGDGGQTGLIGGTRVSKDEIRIHTYGSVDELNSWIGMVRDQDVKSRHKEILISIQTNLFTLGSHLATDFSKSKMELPTIEDAFILELENQIDTLEEELAPMTHFILPGGHIAVSTIHIARCVCRRAERLAVQMSEEFPVNPLIIQYLNRLSDYLFVLSRSMAKDTNSEEIPWITRKQSS